MAPKIDLLDCVSKLAKLYGAIESVNDVFNDTFKDMVSRAPGKIASAVTSEYNIKKKEITPSKKYKIKKAGSITIHGQSLTSLEFRFAGRRLTPIHFSMTPKSRPKSKVYKAVPTEPYYTIGYGHYGPDVKQGMKITFSMAEEYLKKDLERFEKAVNNTGLKLDQNQFDALVSFTYNCGEGCLKTLIKNRTHNQIADAMLLYNKSGGKVYEGLNRRRKKERELFLTPAKTISDNRYKVTASVLNVRNGAGTSFKVIRTLNIGTVVNVLSFSGDWAKTEFGWCSKQYLQKI